MVSVITTKNTKQSPHTGKWKVARACSQTLVERGTYFFFCQVAWLEVPLFKVNNWEITGMIGVRTPTNTGPTYKMYD
jgi:hypothetical protein